MEHPAAASVVDQPDTSVDSFSFASYEACLDELRSQGIPVDNAVVAHAKYCSETVQTIQKVIPAELQSQLAGLPHLPDAVAFDDDLPDAIPYEDFLRTEALWGAKIYANYSGKYLHFSALTPTQLELLCNLESAISNNSHGNPPLLRQLHRDGEVVSVEGIKKFAILQMITDACTQAAGAASEADAIAVIVPILQKCASLDTVLVEDSSISGVRKYRASTDVLKRLLKVVEENNWNTLRHELAQSEALLWNIFSSNRTGINPMDVKGAYADLHDLSEERIEKIRHTNMSNVLEHITARSQRPSDPLTLADILKLHQMALANLIPEFLLERFRKSPVYIGKLKGTDAPQIESEMTELLARANQLLSQRDMETKKLIYEMSELLLEYSRIHPHVDGNGTTELCFGELIAQLSGLPPANLANPDYILRMRSVFRGFGLPLLHFAEVQAKKIGETYLTRKIRTFADSDW